MNHEDDVKNPARGHKVKKKHHPEGGHIRRSLNTTKIKR